MLQNKSPCGMCQWREYSCVTEHVEEDRRNRWIGKGDPKDIIWQSSSTTFLGIGAVADHLYSTKYLPR